MLPGVNAAAATASDATAAAAAAPGPAAVPCQAQESGHDCGGVVDVCCVLAALVHGDHDAHVRGQTVG